MDSVFIPRSPAFSPVIWRACERSSQQTPISPHGNRTLLQMVTCDAVNLSGPMGAAAALVHAGASMAEPQVAAAGVDSREILGFSWTGCRGVSAPPPPAAVRAP